MQSKKKAEYIWKERQRSVNWELLHLAHRDIAENEIRYLHKNRILFRIKVSKELSEFIKRAKFYHSLDIPYGVILVFILIFN